MEQVISGREYTKRIPWLLYLQPRSLDCVSTASDIDVNIKTLLFIQGPIHQYVRFFIDKTLDPRKELAAVWYGL